jgi:hypothetical protein
MTYRKFSVFRIISNKTKEREMIVQTPNNAKMSNEIQNILSKITKKAQNYRSIYAPTGIQMFLN